MKYKYEMHLHTSEVSKCAKVTAKDAVKMYIDAGYDGIVVTDHFSDATFSRVESENWDDRVDFFLKGWQNAAAAANGRISVLLGMEVRLHANKNDYLVYGADGKFMRAYPDMLDLKIGEFVELAHKNGLLVYQAHPFRNLMTILTPGTVDGIESYNGGPRHDSRNDIAKMWAKKFGLKTISGSDFHRPEDCARGGIITNARITDSQDLITCLNGESYSNITASNEQ